MHNNLLLANPAGGDKLYVEDVFSTYLYTGNGSTQTITNGIDLAGKGGLVWVKARNIALPNYLIDTDRGGNKILRSESTSGNSNQTNPSIIFNNNGFSLDDSAGASVNYAGSPASTYASWTFRKAPKFFDVVTFTTSSGATVINHALGSTPGMVIIKRVDATSNWLVWQRTLAAQNYLLLSSTAASADLGAVWCTPTATNVTFENTFSAAGQSWVAYLFAHDTTADGVIQCGSGYAPGGTGQAVNLGWEPQFLIVKAIDSPSAGTNLGLWAVHDNMRGNTLLQAQSSAAEINYGAGGLSSGAIIEYTPTGFKLGSGFFSSNNTNYIYLAIRRGPMRTPTDATKVFASSLQSANSTAQSKSYGIVTDAMLAQVRGASGYGNSFWTRQVGPNLHLSTQSTSAQTSTTDAVIGFDLQDGLKIGADSSAYVQRNANWVHWAFRRAPSFFDVVCYTGTGSFGNVVNHNLGVVPELIITKSRSGTGSWFSYSKYLSYFSDWTDAAGYISFLNDTSARQYYGGVVLDVSSSSITWNAIYSNTSGLKYVAYLFASCPGVSKVGSYTGNGSSLNIDCGFTNGARFVLIKRTDSTGDWYVWDTARGIVSANDPHLSLNTTAGEVTTDDTIDPLSTGFTVNQVSATNVNVSSATYIYLAIA